MQFVSSVRRQEIVDPYDTYGIVDFTHAQRSNGARDVEDKSAHSRSRIEGFGRYQYVTGEEPSQNMRSELIFAHAAEILEDGVAFRVSRFAKDQRNASAIGPIAPLAEENGTQV